MEPGASHCSHPAFPMRVPYDWSIQVSNHPRSVGSPNQQHVPLLPQRELVPWINLKLRAFQKIQKKARWRGRSYTYKILGVLLFIVGVWWCPPMIDNDSIFRLGNQDKLQEVACLCQCQVFVSFQSSQRFQEQAFSESLQHGVWRGTTGRVSLHPRWEIPSKNQPTYFSKHALHEWYFLSPMFSHRIRKGTELWGQWRRCTALELWESFGGPMFVVPDRWEPQFPSFEGHPTWKQKNPSWLHGFTQTCAIWTQTYIIIYGVLDVINPQGHHLVAGVVAAVASMKHHSKPYICIPRFTCFWKKCPNFSLGENFLTRKAILSLELYPYFFIGYFRTSDQPKATSVGLEGLAITAPLLRYVRTCCYKYMCRTVFVHLLLPHKHLSRKMYQVCDSLIQLIHGYQFTYIASTSVIQLI